MLGIIYLDYLFTINSFFRALEGDRDEVESCYVRICRDTRHGASYIVWQGDFEERTFPSCSMGYRMASDLDGNDKKSIIYLADLVAKDVKSIGNDLLISVLIRVLFDASKGRGVAD